MKVTTTCYDFREGGADHLRCSQVSLKVWTRSRAVLDHGALAWVMLGDPGSVDCMMDCPCTWAVQEVSGVHITCSWAIFLGLFGWLVGEVDGSIGSFS